VNRTQIHGVPGCALVIRPACAADLAGLGTFFAGLSTRSRAQRFFAPITPGPAMLARLCGVLRPGPVAGRGPAPADVIVAAAGGAIIGHAMAADHALGDGGQATDIGVVVADAWQHQGVGAALTRALLAGAAARGVSWLTMDVLPGNHQALGMITGHWRTARPASSADCLTYRIPLAAPGLLAGHQRAGTAPAGSLNRP
jgi:GNAT superfamily N-acetyltransferase